ncbi:MAG TPA: Gfo/Idh/MocA family oxidoreductase, partial [Fimbriimonas sp.]
SGLDSLIDACDAVSVVTPDQHHAEPSIRILEAGRHLLCEKPLTVTLEDSRKVARAAVKASEKGVVHMTNFSYRSSAGFQEAIKLVREGKLGHLRHTHSFYLQTWLSNDLWGNWSTEGFLWRLDKRTSGGVLGDVGCHILDMTTAIVGEVKRVRCDLRTFPKVHEGKLVTKHGGKNLDANDSAIISLEFGDGSVGIVQTTRWATGHLNSLRCEVHGTEGALCVDLDKSYRSIDLCLGRDAKKAVWKTKELKPTPNNYQRFIKSIKTGRQDQPDILRGAQIQAYLDACERSAESGQWEDVAAWV